MKLRLFCASTMFVGFIAATLSAQVVDTAFTVNGQVTRDSSELDETCAFSFSLWSAADGGIQIGTTQVVESVTVHRGLFSAKIDFGGDAFGGQRRWLQSEVQCNGDAKPIPVMSRREIHPAPVVDLTRSSTDQIPPGVIALWSGSIAEVPEGWALCDGANGTPDLRDRFVYGVGTGEEPGATGGETTHSHLVSSHSHAVDAPETAVQNGGAHGHTLFPHQHTVDPANTNSSSAGSHSHSDNPPATTSSSSSSHSHTLNPGSLSTASGGSHNHGGSSNNAGGSYGVVLAKDNDGVAKSHSHSIGSAGSHSHSIDIPSSSSSGGNHTHSFDAASYASATNGNHTHSFNVPSVTTSFSGVGTTVLSGEHNHSVDLVEVESGATAPESTLMEHLPQYYKLAYIMRL